MSERVSALATGKPSVAIQPHPNRSTRITGTSSSQRSKSRSPALRFSCFQASLGPADRTAASRSGVNGESILIAARP